MSENRPREFYGPRIDTVMDWWRGNRPAPYHIELYPTNRCNLQCKHCWQRQDNYDKTYKSEMSDERLLRLVEEAGDLGVQMWTIKGGGEPMARGKLVMKMCEDIVARKMFGVIHTNGSLFKEEQIQRLVDIQWWRFHFSIDAPEQGTNDYIRTGGFEKAARAMSLFRDHRTRLGSEFPHMIINMVVTRTNYHLLAKMAEFAAEHGAHTVNISGTIWFSEMCNEFMPDEKMRQELPAAVEEGIKRARDLGVITNFADLLDEQLTGDPNNMSYGAPYEAKRGINESLCFAPFTDLTIHPDGLVGPCCMSYDRKSNSIQDHSLEEVWYGEYMEMVRRNFLQNRPMTYCIQCPTSLYRGIGEARVKVNSAIAREEARRGWRLPVTLAARTYSTMREKGIGETITRAREWIALNR